MHKVTRWHYSLYACLTIWVWEIQKFSKRRGIEEEAIAEDLMFHRREKPLGLIKYLAPCFLGTLEAVTG